MAGLPLIGSSLHGFVVYSHTVLSADEQAITEAKVKAACEAAQFQDATTLAIQCYGPEIFGYLVAVTRNQMDADDAFGIFCESVWTNLSGFQWRSSLRTWLYSVARSALGRVLRAPHRKRERGIPLSQAGAGELAEHVRTATKEYLLSSARDRLESIKQKLSAEDHTLLILRVNRNMAWNEIAVIVSDGAELSDEEIKRKAASLRKRFERTKEQLRQLMRQDTAEPE